MQSTATWRNALGPAVLGIVIAFACLLAVYRGTEVEAALDAASRCDHCFFWQALRSDSWLIGLIAALGSLALLARTWLTRVLFVGAMLGLLGLMAADLLIFHSLALRLQFSDIAKFGAEFQAIHRFLAIYFGHGWPWLVAGTGAFLVGVIVFAAQVLRQHLRGAVLLGVCALTAFVSASAGSDKDLGYVHQESVRNWLANNLDQGVAKPYSGRFIDETLRHPPQEGQVCAQGSGNKRNIILLVVESLSAYHSARMGGRGWTPRLDVLAEESVWYADFHANGFTTDQGLIALLTGRDPLPSVGRYGSSQAYAGFGHSAGTVPTALKAQGYSTQFFTTGSLQFLNKGGWCSAIGFEHVEGAEHPYYNNFPRFHFNAAPDAALFGRFLEWFSTRDRQVPFFATLLTVSSHPPFIDPESGAASEEAVIRYVDQQIGDFHRQLKATGFFDNGLLIITGDHRAMTPVSPAESAAYGERAFSRVPLLVVGEHAGPPGPITTRAQQIDLPQSLQALVAPNYCRPRSRGQFLIAPKEAPTHILHVRGDHRSWLSVYTQETDSTIYLAGDDTAWMGQAPPDGQAILDSVNWQRITLGNAPQDVLPLMIELKKGAR